MEDNKVSVSKKQYGLLCVLACYLGWGILLITAFVPVIQVKVLDIGLNAFQLISAYGWESENTNLFTMFISVMPMVICGIAVISCISTTASLKKTILPRITNDECINTLVKHSKDNLWSSIFYVIAAGVLILIETKWDFLALIPGESMYTTMTYIPLVFQIVVYCIVKILKPSEDGKVFVSEKNTQHTQNHASIDSVNDDRIVELLMKYKELLDNGIITQEEYDQKKQEIWRKQNEK